jgi:hypothetical protein
MNDLEKFRNVFDGIEPWSGFPPAGKFVDFFGTLIDSRFREPSGENPAHADGSFVQTKVPSLESSGEFWFEAVNWVESAKQAKHRYVMMSLGAAYGYQAVGAAKVLRLLNDMPFKLVCVEPEPTQIEWIKLHMLDNGILPESHWLLPAVLSDQQYPVFFPVGSPGSGAQNCFSTNEFEAREQYVQSLTKTGNAAQALKNLIMDGTTGIHKNLIPGMNFDAEIKILSAVQLESVLAPFEYIDFIEADLQQSEVLVFPPAQIHLKRKVKRLSIGTHGQEAHILMREMLLKGGWELIFDFSPNTFYQTSLGSFETNDGVITALNPEFP